MIIFNVDMDNTLIYSYKHDIGHHKRCVEIYQNRDISYITEKTQELLVCLSKKVLIVPTTTRTIEQYNRIQLGLKDIPFALVCNGGVLLKDGIEDQEWYRKSLDMILESKDELIKGRQILTEDKDRCFEIRNIKDLFVFTKSDQPKETVKRLSSMLNTGLVDVFNNGIKIYIVPKKLSKGNAVKRLKKMLGADKIIAAGDSQFDVSMLKCADIAIAPEKLRLGETRGNVVRISEHVLFSEGVLEHVLNVI